MNNRETAKRLARDIFACGNEDPARPAVRLQYRVGTLEHELPGGGFVERALSNYLEQLLNSYAVDGGEKQ